MSNVYIHVWNECSRNTRQHEAHWNMFNEIGKNKAYSLTFLTAPPKIFGALPATLTQFLSSASLVFLRVFSKSILLHTIPHSNSGEKPTPFMGGRTAALSF